MDFYINLLYKTFAKGEITQFLKPQSCGFLMMLSSSYMFFARSKINGLCSCNF